MTSERANGSMNRRSFLSRVAILPCCIANLAGQEWNYGDAGPEKWGTLGRSFSACVSGSQQSPVDLRDGIKADLPGLSVNLPAAPVTVLNNGHTIQVNLSPEGSFSAGAATFHLVQLHFHTPSEHSILGRGTAMEVHFVHAHPDQGLTVLSGLLTPGHDNPAFSAIMGVAPRAANIKASTPNQLRFGNCCPPNSVPAGVTKVR
jgi:carbonic anhydrase